MPKKVLVTGGAGFIGSHIADAYLDRGDRVWIIDDLSTGKRANLPAGAEFLQASVSSPEIEAVFRAAGGFDLISHHAAQIDVRKSVLDPRHDAEINILGLLNVIEVARRHGLGRIVFVSSGGVVYGEPEDRPTPETAPKLPLSPYGVSKLTSEYYLFYNHHIHGLDYAALRYANVYGPRQDPHGEAGVVAIFSQRIDRGEPIMIFGDGEQTRDYVFVRDIVRAHLAVGDATLPRGTCIDDRAFNVGTGRETSVNTLATTLMRAAGRAVPKVHAEARPGELRHSCLSNARLRALGWEPGHTLEEGLSATYQYLTKEQSR